MLSLKDLFLALIHFASLLWNHLDLWDSKGILELELLCKNVVEMRIASEGYVTVKMLF